MTYFGSVLRNKAATAAAPHIVVNMIMGNGSSMRLTIEEKDENRRAKKLQMPRAVAQNMVGKKYELATKLILKQQVTPNFVIKNITRNTVDS